ncbi:Asp23/Gls24 family envelope stress response protein [Curtobacterium sp. UCD-KPL2560]|uniref:Asp23/Gls24 family envelope stress response protein n=1 Tax=Curtobacterium sp. UCD-KPL2560 TaxID=1885315 RepID=UPI00082629A7|nr:Asp23/Gls24 family envelope stress response protein [Curtobacterium sp. UCD-KPL2560]
MAMTPHDDELGADLRPDGTGAADASAADPRSGTTSAADTHPDDLRLDALEPEDLDGHSIDELADYLDAGMQPADPSIDDSAACQNALAAIIRLRQSSLGSLEAAAAQEPPADESWIGGVLANISLEARAGRDVPLRAESPTERPVMTEGAIRSLVRSAGDVVPGVVIARCSLDGDVVRLGAPVRVTVELAVRAGSPIHDAADRVRSAVAAVLAEQTDLVVEAVDVRVRDLLPALPDDDHEPTPDHEPTHDEDGA